MVNQVSHHLADGAKPVKQLKDEPYRRLSLLVRIQNDLTGRMMQITHW
jgi:hypothetical protein